MDELFYHGSVDQLARRLERRCLPWCALCLAVCLCGGVHCRVCACVCLAVRVCALLCVCSLLCVYVLHTLQPLVVVTCSYSLVLISIFMCR